MICCKDRKKLLFAAALRFYTRSGSVLITSNWASVASVSNSVKSWVSQNSPIFSSESALEMLLSLFSSIGFAFFVAHVASADDNGGLTRRFVNEKDRKISAAKRLTKCTAEDAEVFQVVGFKCSFLNHIFCDMQGVPFTSVLRKGQE